MPTREEQVRPLLWGFADAIFAVGLRGRSWEYALRQSEPAMLKDGNRARHHEGAEA
jgi:hypothetical protein